MCVRTLSTTQKRRRDGLCPGCGKAWTGPTHYCPPCHAKNVKRARKRRKARNGMCSRCVARRPAYGSAYCQICKISNREANIKRRAKCRELVILAYGGKCACCGKTNHRVMQLDHVNGDGGKHRAKIGEPMWRWAYRNDCPSNLQILCADCHHIKTIYGKCLPTDHATSRTQRRPKRSKTRRRITSSSS